jgi:hypothetical protein
MNCCNILLTLKLHLILLRIIYITKYFGRMCNSEQRMSGFEKFVINMSIRYAISECTNSPSTAFYASDKGFNALDGVLDFMKVIANLYCLLIMLIKYMICVKII